MTAAATPPDQNSAPRTEQEQAVCLRCKSRSAVNDDGFCDRCEKAMEQACL